MMFDPKTEAQIRSGAPLPGLDLDNLSRRLTEAYSRVVGLRASSRTASTGDEEFEWLRRLADTYEAYVCLLPEASEHLKGCAFVAGTAHGLVHRLTELSGRDDAARAPLTRGGVAPDVTAALLFLIAGAFADAAEAGGRIRVTGPEPQLALVRRLQLLSLGEVRKLGDEPELARLSTTEDLEQDAVTACWLLLAQGLRDFAIHLLGHDELAYQRAIVRFQRVRDSSVLHIDVDVGRGREAAMMTLSGPHHLATLLLRLVERLSRSALGRIVAPPGLTSGSWQEFTRRLAGTRALLWPNHLDALARGFLSPGVSAVVTFPTGAGKTTLLQLKLGVAALAGKDVLYLAPTRALIDQAVRDLSAALDTLVRLRRVLDDEAHQDDDDDQGRSKLPKLFVTTPEECLAAITRVDGIMDNLGAVAFDECHLLHPESGLSDHRALGAMLCLLGLLETAPTADLVLVSAMVANGKELAEWIGRALGRTCLALEDEWKPTRQVRGCVVYPEAEIRDLAEKLHARRLEAIRVNRDKPQWKGKPSAVDGRDLFSQPFSLFGLTHRWQTHEATDYSIQPIADRPALLTTGVYHDPFTDVPERWYLTPNRNGVAALVGGALAASGVKTMILCQSTRVLESTARGSAALLAERGTAVTALTEEERRLFDEAVEELGGVEHVQGFVDERVAVHHGLLLPAERRAAEQVFRRPDGVPAIVVSPTMSQGVNLPAEAVVIAGEERFDPATERMEPLNAFELLNAAGRAGRAGSCANGIVIVVPGAVVHFSRGPDGHVRTLDRRWFDLQEKVFANLDGCLAVNDPLEVWLDAIQHRADTGAAIDPAEERFYAHFAGTRPPELLLTRSLVAFRRRSDSGFAKVVRTFIERRAIGVSGLPWQEDVARAFGVPSTDVVALDGDLPAVLPADVEEWIAWWTDWLGQDARRARVLLDDEILKDLGWAEPGDEGMPNDLFPRARDALTLWVQGRPLVAIEQQMAPGKKLARGCPTARKLCVRVVPRVAWVFGLAHRILVSRPGSGAAERPDPLAEHLDACVRLGVDSLEKLALASVLSERDPRERTRVAIHEAYSRLEGRLATTRPIVAEDWRVLRARVRQAWSEAETEWDEDGDL